MVKIFYMKIVLKSKKRTAACTVLRQSLMQKNLFYVKKFPRCNLVFVRNVRRSVRIFSVKLAELNSLLHIIARCYFKAAAMSSQKECSVQVVKILWMYSVVLAFKLILFCNAPTSLVLLEGETTNITGPIVLGQKRWLIF